MAVSRTPPDQAQAVIVGPSFDGDEQPWRRCHPRSHGLELDSDARKLLLIPLEPAGPLSDEAVGTLHLGAEDGGTYVGQSVVVSNLHEEVAVLRIHALATEQPDPSLERRIVDRNGTAFA
jgi:hypothetical protein